MKYIIVWILLLLFPAIGFCENRILMYTMRVHPGTMGRVIDIWGCQVADVYACKQTYVFVENRLLKAAYTENRYEKVKAIMQMTATSKGEDKISDRLIYVKSRHPKNN